MPFNPAVILLILPSIYGNEDREGTRHINYLRVEGGLRRIQKENNTTLFLALAIRYIPILFVVTTDADYWLFLCVSVLLQKVANFDLSFRDNMDIIGFLANVAL